MSAFRSSSSLLSYMTSLSELKQVEQQLKLLKQAESLQAQAKRARERQQAKQKQLQKKQEQLELKKQQQALKKQEQQLKAQQKLEQAKQKAQLEKLKQKQKIQQLKQKQKVEQLKHKQRQQIEQLKQKKQLPKKSPSVESFPKYLSNVSNQTKTVKKTNNFSDKIVNDYRNLLKSGEYSDVTLIVDDTPFPVHRSIVSARSPVLANMILQKFSNKKLNSENPHIELPDLAIDVCEELLQFVYTGKIEMPELYAFELLVAAEKYEMNDLKEMCERELCSTVNSETVADLLLYANMNNAQLLRAECVEFMSGV